MTEVSTVPVHEQIQRVYALLRAGDYKAALAEAEALGAAVSGADTDPAAGEAWTAIGRARREMGRFAGAEEAGLWAVSALATSVGREHALYAAGVAELARAYEELGRWTQAESLGRQALAIRRQVLGNEHPDTAQSLSDLSTALEWQGRFVEAEACAREAVDIFRQTDLARHPARPQVVAYLAFTLQWRGNYAAALEAATEANRLAETIFPAGHPERATAAGGLGRLLQNGYRTETPERLITGALAVRRAALGEDHPFCASTLQALAGLRQMQRHPEDAEPLVREALRLVEAAYGPNHVRAADACERLAGVLMDREQYDAAEPLFRRAADIYERELGADNPITLEAKNALAGLLVQTARAEDAVAICRRAIERYTNEAPGGRSDAFQALARALGEAGYLVEAAAAATTAVQILRATPGTAPSWLAYALGTLSWYQLAVGEVADGVASAKEAFDLTASVAGNDNLATIDAARALASAHLQQGEAARAESVIRSAMASAPKPTPKLDLRPDLAAALAAQDRIEPAEELHLDILAERRKGSDEDPALADALIGLGYFYESCGNLGAAEPRYLEALEIHRAVDPDGIGVGRALHALAALRHSAGLLPAALEHYRQALDAYRKAAGEDSVEVAVCRHGLARLYLDAGDTTQAETAIREAIQVLSRRGERNAEHLSARQTLASVLVAKGNYPEARDTLLAVLAATQESYGPAHAATVAVRSELAGVHIGEGDLLAAEPLVREVAERNRELYPDDPRLANDESRLAQVYARFGEYEPARRHVDRYLAIVRKAGAADTPAYAFGLLLLADIHLLREDFPAALKATQDALDIRRRAFGAAHPLVAVTLQQSAALKLDLGRLRDARADAAEATAVIHRLVGSEHPEYAIAMRSEAAISSVAAPDTTGDLLRRAVELERRCYGDKSPLRVPGLIARSDWYLARREFPPAEQLLREAAGILRHAATDENLAHAGVASRLGSVLLRTSRAAEAGQYFRQALGIATRVLGPEHPDATGAARRLGWWHVTQGAFGEALAGVERALPGEDAWAAIAGDTAMPLDRYKSASDAILTDRLRIGLLTHLPGADVLPAYTRLLRDRAREAELFDGSPLVRLGRTVAGRADDLTRWRRLRVQVAETTLAGPLFVKPDVHLARLARWRDEERAAAAGFPSAPELTPQVISGALPPDGTLVEFVRVIEELDHEDRSRYAAFVLRWEDAVPKLIDLGAAAETDRLAAEWVGSLAKGGRESPCGQQLADALFAPLLPHLGQGGELFVVADTALRTLPFAALPVPGGRLVDRFAVTLLTVAAALLDRPALPSDREPIVVAAAVGAGPLTWLRWMLTGRVYGGTAVAARLGVTARDATGDWTRHLSGGVFHVAVPGALDADPPLVTGKPATRYVAPPTRYGARWGSLRLTAARVRELRLTPGAVLVMPETLPAAGPAGAESLTWVARAFRRAGAGATVFGLWSNPEWADHWESFYNALRAETAPAESLRQAQLRAKQQGLPPAAWGGFVCVAG